MCRIATCLVIVCVSTFQLAHGAEFLFGVPEKMGEPINSSNSDFAMFSADGQSVYVVRGGVDGGPMYVSERSGESWGPLEKLGENINGADSNGAGGWPSLTADGLNLFFSDKFGHYGSIGRDGFGGGDLWLSTRPTVDAEWGEATNVGETVNSQYLDADASISADGLSLFFTSNRPGGSGREDIWMTSRSSTSSPWKEPENLGPVVNGPTPDMVPSISPDGLTLFFERGDPLPDIWVTSRADVDGDWGEPVNLGPTINTSFAETAAQLSADGSTLYFSRWNSLSGFDEFSVELMPFERASLQVGLDPYEENFDDALGANGSSIGTVLPAGWAQSENGVVLENTTTQTFPVGTSVGPGVYNAGAEGSLDRTLASSLKTIQLLGDVTGADASSFRLKFDVEAWDSRDGTFVAVLDRFVNLPDDPGEAAFQVTVDLDTGDGFAPLADFGTVTTGPTLQPVFEGIVNGNSDANRISFDSGIVGAMIPSGSTLRVRWSPGTERQTAGWLFGIDNVSLGLLESVDSAGDFNKDGVLDVADVDLLTAEIAGGTTESTFDLSGDGVVDDADLKTWLSEAAEHNGFSVAYLAGDSDLDGSVDAGDLNNLALNWRQDVSLWSAGDFNADGSVDAGDLNELALKWRQSIPLASAVSAPVPEPSAWLLALFGLSLVWRRPRRSSGRFAVLLPR